MSFEVGDKAAYPARGVVEVMGVEEREVGGHTLTFYVLRSLESEDKVLVPVANANERGLRSLVDAERAEELYALLDADGSLDLKEPPNRRHRQLKERLDSGSAFDVAAVYRDLQRLREQKQLSFGEVRMLDLARTRLATELALVEERSTDDVARALDARFSLAA